MAGNNRDFAIEELVRLRDYKTRLRMHIDYLERLHTDLVERIGEIERQVHLGDGL